MLTIEICVCTSCSWICIRLIVKLRLRSRGGALSTSRFRRRLPGRNRGETGVGSDRRPSLCPEERANETFTFQSSHESYLFQASNDSLAAVKTRSDLHYNDRVIDEFRRLWRFSTIRIGFKRYQSSSSWRVYSDFRPAEYSTRIRFLWRNITKDNWGSCNSTPTPCFRLWRCPLNQQASMRPRRVKVGW